MVELMVTIALIAILITICMPVYNRYMTTSRVQSIFPLIHNCQLYLQDFAAQNHRSPNASSAAELAAVTSICNISNTYINSIGYTNNASSAEIEVVMATNSKLADASGTTLTIYGNYITGGQLQWNCMAANTNLPTQYIVPDLLTGSAACCTLNGTVCQ